LEVGTLKIWRKKPISICGDALKGKRMDLLQLISILLSIEEMGLFPATSTRPNILLMVVPRNDAIFPKLHTNRHS
jgi:hypothetical protein